MKARKLLINIMVIEKIGSRNRSDGGANCDSPQTKERKRGI
jgi:hypothetical protein